MFAYCLMCWGPPFPLFLIAYLFNGFGLGLQVRTQIHAGLADGQDSQVNSMTARLPNANTKMFLLHAFYGFGATISPLVATEFVKREADRVYLYFAVSLGFAAVTVALLLVVFRLKTEDQVVGRRAVADEVVSTDEKHMTQDAEPELAREPEQEVERKKVEGSGGKMKRIMKTPAAHFMAFYLAVYVSQAW